MRDRNFTQALPEQIVSDDTLRDLKRGEMGWSQGVMSPACQAMLCMILPDIADELLHLRHAEGMDTDQAARVEGLAQHILDHVVEGDMLVTDIIERLGRIEAMQAQALTEAMHGAGGFVEAVARDMARHLPDGDAA